MLNFKVLRWGNRMWSFSKMTPLISLMWMVHRVCWVPCVCTSTFIHKFKLNELSTKNKQGILDQSTWSKLLLFVIPLLYYFSYSLCTCTHTGPYADFVYIDKRKKMSGNQIKREKFTERLEYSVVPKSMTSNLLAKIWSQPLSHDKIWWWHFKLCLAGKWPKVDLLINNSCMKSHLAFWINDKE